MDTLKKIRLTHIFATIIILLAASVQRAQAKSVYAITNRGASTISAYDIQGDQLVHHSNATGGVPNPVGLAYDPRSEILFVTYEGSLVIEMLNTKTMKFEQNSTSVPGPGQLAGIVFDQAKRKLYVVKRGTANLFVYSWDAGELTLEVDNPKTLNGLDTNGAFGLALDLRNHRLFATDATNTVNYYNTDTWTHQGSVNIVVGPTQERWLLLTATRTPIRYCGASPLPAAPISMASVVEFTATRPAQR
ncbi:MAG: YncE family protein [Planctomycetota bacterium]|jgi:DNA-binding beta-propeller fold protein YncE